MPKHIFMAEGDIEPCTLTVPEGSIRNAKHLKMHLRSGDIADAVAAAPSRTEFLISNTHPELDLFLSQSCPAPYKTIVVDEPDLFDTQQWRSAAASAPVSLALSYSTHPDTAALQCSLDTTQYVGPGGIVYARRLDEDLEVASQMIGALATRVQESRCVPSIGLHSFATTLKGCNISYSGMIAETVARTLGGCLLRHSHLWPQTVSPGPHRYETFTTLCIIAGHLNAPVVLSSQDINDRTFEVAKLCGVPRIVVTH